MIALTLTIATKIKKIEKLHRFLRRAKPQQKHQSYRNEVIENQVSFQTFIV